MTLSSFAFLIFCTVLTSDRISCRNYDHVARIGKKRNVTIE